MADANEEQRIGIGAVALLLAVAASIAWYATKRSTGSNRPPPSAWWGVWTPAPITDFSVPVQPWAGRTPVSDGVTGDQKLPLAPSTGTGDAAVPGRFAFASDYAGGTVRLSYLVYLNSGVASYTLTATALLLSGGVTFSPGLPIATSGGGVQWVGETRTSGSNQFLLDAVLTVPAGGGAFQLPGFRLQPVAGAGTGMIPAAGFEWVRLMAVELVSKAAGTAEQPLANTDGSIIA